MPAHLLHSSHLDETCHQRDIMFRCLGVIAACCCSDSVLDEPPRSRDGSIITPTVAKSIIGQAVLQLSVMAALLGPLGVALVATGQPDVTGVVDVDHTCQYTLVFNSFVIMQLFNQVRDSSCWVTVLDMSIAGQTIHCFVC